MQPDYWIKQTDAPAFPDLVWSRPENRAQAGKLLIISGSAAGFSVAGQAYMVAETAGAGVVRVVMPELLPKQVPKEVAFELDFAPSVPLGGFSKKALGDLLIHSAWADMVLIPGGIGRNSETTVTIEQFVEKHPGPVVLAEDALDIFITNPRAISAQANRILIADFSQLQKMWHKLMPGQPAIAFSMPLPQLVELLHEATLQVACMMVTQHQDTLLVAYKGQVSTTTNEDKLWRVETAAKAAVWAMQHRSQLFEAVTTAVKKHD